MLTRREVLALMGGLPFARPDQHYEPPEGGLVPGSRSGVLIARKVIIIGTTGGLFVYSPTAALGNLVASIAAQDGTDPYGQPYLHGITSYQITGHISGLAVNMHNGIITYWSSAGEGSPWSAGAATSGDAAGDLVFTPLAGQTVISQSKMTISDAVTTGSVLSVTDTASSPGAVIRATANAIGDLFFGGFNSADTNFRIILDSTAVTGLTRIRLGSGAAAPDVLLVRAAANLLQLQTADLDVSTAGRGLQVAEGSNAKQGTATLAAGTVTVANTSVTASSRIFLTAQNSGAAPGALRVSARTAGTSFTITSTSGTDTSLVAYEIFEPG